MRISQLAALQKQISPPIEPMTMFALEMRKAQVREEVMKAMRKQGGDNSETEVAAAFEAWWQQTGHKAWLEAADGR